MAGWLLLVPVDFGSEGNVAWRLYWDYWTNDSAQRSEIWDEYSLLYFSIKLSLSVRERERDLGWVSWVWCYQNIFTIWVCAQIRSSNSITLQTTAASKMISSICIFFQILKIFLYAINKAIWMGNFFWASKSVWICDIFQSFLSPNS